MKYFLKTFLVNLRLSASFKMSFLITLILSLVKFSLVLFAWDAFFLKYQTVRGWSFNEMVAMFGLVSFGIGFVEMFFYGLREIPRLIDTHELDIFLLQPKNLILNIATSKGEVSSFSEVLLGIILLTHSGYIFSPYIVPIAFLSSLFIFSLYLYLSSIRFFISNGTNFVRELYQSANIVATQPHSAFNGLFKIFTTTLLPTVFMSFYPIEFLKTNRIELFLLAAFGTLLFCMAACVLFFVGLKRYESGNALSHRQ